MAGNDVGAVGNGLFSGVTSPRATRATSAAGDVLTPSGGSRVRGETSGSGGLRRSVVNVEGSELDTRAPRGTYLDILV